MVTLSIFCKSKFANADHLNTDWKQPILVADH